MSGREENCEVVYAIGDPVALYIDEPPAFGMAYRRAFFPSEVLWFYAADWGRIKV